MEEGERRSSSADVSQDAVAKAKNTGRSAEKNRKSTCAFADAIARASIAKWHELTGQISDTPAAEQTVVACILAVLPETSDAIGKSERLEVLSLGAGTKFMRTRDIAKDKEAGVCIHDCHAEVLARRGFLHLLIAEMQIVASGLSSRLVEQIPDEIPDEQDNKVFTSPVSARTFRIKPSISIHLYTSSSPCGNSTVRRWGISSPENFWPEHQNEKDLVWPEPVHQQIDLAQRHEGQIAACVKRDVDETYTSTTVSSQNDISQDKKAPRSCYAIGTAEPNSGKGNILSCSDKIALWNALGVQGALLSNIMHPVYLATVTVGRKFSRKHIHRAICCRLQEIPECSSEQFFQHSSVERNSIKPSQTPWFRLNHPASLCTGVKLNPGEIDQTTKASFTKARCLVWGSSFKQGRAVDIDWESGLETGSNMPLEICRRDIFLQFENLWRVSGNDACPAVHVEAGHAAAAPWTVAKVRTPIGRVYQARKSLALELMLSRKVPVFARKKKSKKRKTPPSPCS